MQYICRLHSWHNSTRRRIACRLDRWCIGRFRSIMCPTLAVHHLKLAAFIILQAIGTTAGTATSSHTTPHLPIQEAVNAESPSSEERSSATESLAYLIQYELAPVTQMIKSQAAQLQLKDEQLARLETQLKVKDSEMVELNILAKLRESQLKALTERCEDLSLELVEIDWVVKHQKAQNSTLVKRAQEVRLKCAGRGAKLHVAQVWRLLC